MPDRRSELVTELLPLVRQLARRYANRGEPLDDLEQVGVIGLMKAIDRYDADRGVDLRAYATPAILGEIRRHFRDRAWAVSVPRSVKDAYVSVGRAVDSLRREHGRSPTVDQIAGVTGLGEDVVLDALAAGSAYRPDSLGGLGRDGAEIDVPIEDDEIGATLERLGFDQTLRTLRPLERQVVRMRFAEDLPQSGIAARLGISQMQVSRLLRASLARLAAEREE